MIMLTTYSLKSTGERTTLKCQDKAQAKRRMPLYLGGVLVLTRIVYHALGASNELPPPVEMPEGVTAKHYTQKIPMDVPQKRKRTPPCKEKAEKAPRPNTRHAAQQVQQEEATKKK